MTYKKSFAVLVATLSLCLFAWVGMLAQSSKPITKKGLEDALKLGGLKSAELISIIQKRGVDFIPTPETEAELQGLGATSELLITVRENYRGAPVPPKSATAPAYNPPAQPPSTPVPAGPVYPRASGIYLKEGSAWVALRQESAEWRKEGLMKGLKMATDGLVKGEATGEVAGTHSSISTHSPASFMIRTETGMGADDYIVVHMHGKHDNREFKIGMNGLHSKDQVEVRASTLGTGMIRIEFEQGAGDYAFISRRVAPTADNYSHGGFLYTFQIVQ